jgi:hypothetical protein
MNIKCDLCNCMFTIRKRIASYYFSDIEIEYRRHLLTCEDESWRKTKRRISK